MQGYSDRVAWSCKEKRRKRLKANKKRKLFKKNL